MHPAAENKEVVQEETSLAGWTAAGSGAQPDLLLTV
jgi:hypothetical protein